jgi:PRC-barrel domain
MDITNVSSRLRYLDASDVDDPRVTFDGLAVRGSDGNKLGDLDGFLVDELSGRAYYAIVDSGGWFKSRRFLLPIGHAQLADDRRSLRADVSREALRQYPEFNEDRFPEFTDDEWRAFEQRMAYACCPDESRGVDAAIQHDTLRHYQQSDWWHADRGRRDRYQPLARRSWRVHRPDRNRDIVSPAPTASRATQDRELVTARERDEHEAMDGGDVSPHLGGRAQPGDVLGIETGGERSYLSETTEDENKRRRDAEKAAGKQKRDENR